MKPFSLVEAIEGDPLKKKTSESLYSGDWSNWTASELGEITQSRQYTESLIRDIVRSGKEFPDNLWEAMVRQQTYDNLSGMLAYAITGTDGNKFFYHPSYYNRLNSHGKNLVTNVAKRMVKLNKDASPEYKAELQGRGISADDESVAKAKEFLNKLKADKAGSTKGQAAAEHSKVSMHPVMTEHWLKYMPSDLPEDPGPWEVVRNKLHTKDRQTIDMVLRELEKHSIVVPNEHGSKVFYPHAYQEMLNKEHIQYPVRVTKNFRGTYHNAQMIRGKDANSALISVGLPSDVEKDWKQNHPKLYDFLKELRKSNHKSVMTAKNPIGWVRVDKLSGEDWLIEELQQDVDNISHEEVGTRKYDAITHKNDHDNLEREIIRERYKMKVEDTKIEIIENWIKVLEENDSENMTEAQKVALRHSEKYSNMIDDVFRAMAYASGSMGWSKSLYDNLFNIVKIRDVLKTLKEMRDSKESYLKSAQVKLEQAKSNIDTGAPESPESQRWLKDQEAVKNFLKDFPRMALHAVRQAAKANGVKRLWWVTYSQKKAIGGANPPRSYTSDSLAKKFGFKKVQINPRATFSDPSYPLLGTNIVSKVMAPRDQAMAQQDFNRDNENNKITVPDDYFWMVPVDQMITERLSLVGQTVFG